MALSDVSNILWRERQLLELLVFKLEEEQLVLAAGRPRWLAYATSGVENVLGEIKHIGLERSVLVADAARALGLSGSPTLRELAGLTPSPWDGIFAEHRNAMLTLAQEIDSITTSNRALLQRPSERDRITTLAQISQAAQTDRAQLSTLQATLRGQTDEVRNQPAQGNTQFLRVQATQSQSTSNGLTMRQDMSDIEAQVMVQLGTRQIASLAAFAASARAVQPSLTDFLK
ncbi:MAG: flagellar protein FlgN [Actinomycetota bacterium]|nr:flagellar protein FlgN [Actinomycetota bacterium]